MGLPAPVFDGAGTLHEALQMRRTSRDLGGEVIPPQALSDILWAAQGVNRRGPFGDPGSTAGSASNSREIPHLRPHRRRARICTSPSRTGSLRSLPVTSASCDRAGAAVRRGARPGAFRLRRRRRALRARRVPGARPPGSRVQKSYYYVDTGLVAQNVYLAAASLGLGAWFHNCDKEAFAQAVGLAPDLRPLFGQTIGYASNSRTRLQLPLRVLPCHLACAPTIKGYPGRPGSPSRKREVICAYAGGCLRKARPGEHPVTSTLMISQPVDRRRPLSRPRLHTR